MRGMATSVAAATMGVGMPGTVISAAAALLAHGCQGQRPHRRRPWLGRANAYNIYLRGDLRRRWRPGRPQLGWGAEDLTSAQMAEAATSSAAAACTAGPETWRRHRLGGLADPNDISSWSWALGSQVHERRERNFLFISYSQPIALWIPITMDCFMDQSSNVLANLIQII